MIVARTSPRNVYLNLLDGAHFHWKSLKACHIAKRTCLSYVFERLYFHEVTVHLNFRYCASFEQEVIKLHSVDSLWNARKGHQKCSVTRGVLRNFAKFTGKHLCQSLFFNKVAGAGTTLAQVFSCEFCGISNNTFSYRTPPVAASELCQGISIDGFRSLFLTENF